MAVRTRSSRRFLERAGLIETRTAPWPAYDPGQDPVAHTPVRPPAPSAEYLGPTQGSPPPDRGRTEPWPHGVTQ